MDIADVYSIPDYNVDSVLDQFNVQRNKTWLSKLIGSNKESSASTSRLSVVVDSSNMYGKLSFQEQSKEKISREQLLCNTLVVSGGCTQTPFLVKIKGQFFLRKANDSHWYVAKDLVRCVAEKTSNSLQVVYFDQLSKSTRQVFVSTDSFREVIDKQLPEKEKEYNTNCMFLRYSCYLSQDVVRTARTLGCFFNNSSFLQSNYSFTLISCITGALSTLKGYRLYVQSSRIKSKKISKEGIQNMTLGIGEMGLAVVATIQDIASGILSKEHFNMIFSSSSLLGRTFVLLRYIRSTVIMFLLYKSIKGSASVYRQIKSCDPTMDNGLKVFKVGMNLSILNEEDLKQAWDNLDLNNSVDILNIASTKLEISAFKLEDIDLFIDTDRVDRYVERKLSQMSVSPSFMEDVDLHNHIKLHFLREVLEIRIAKEQFCMKVLGGESYKVLNQIFVEHKNSNLVAIKELCESNLEVASDLEKSYNNAINNLRRQILGDALFFMAIASVTLIIPFFLGIVTSGWMLVVIYALSMCIDFLYDCSDTLGYIASVKGLYNSTNHDQSILVCSMFFMSTSLIMSMPISISGGLLIEMLLFGITLISIISIYGVSLYFSRKAELNGKKEANQIKKISNIFRDKLHKLTQVDVRSH